MSRRVTRDAELLKTKYSGRIIIDSEEFGNIAYAAAGDCICIMSLIDGRWNKIPGTITDMRRLADEIIDVCDLREGLRDWGKL